MGVPSAAGSPEVEHSVLPTMGCEGTQGHKAPWGAKHGLDPLNMQPYKALLWCQMCVFTHFPTTHLTTLGDDPAGLQGRASSSFYPVQTAEDGQLGANGRGQTRTGSSRAAWGAPTGCMRPRGSC